MHGMWNDGQLCFRDTKAYKRQVSVISYISSGVVCNAWSF